jgi:glycosyltransferase involved in cell wall biosynthesis
MSHLQPLGPDRRPDPRSGSAHEPVPGATPEPLKVALVSDCYVPRLGGIEMQVHDLAQHLVRAGHDVVVVTPTPGDTVVDGVRVVRLDVPLLPFDVPFSRATFRQLLTVLEREHVDVVHFNGGIVSPLAYVGAAQAQDHGIPTVVTTHCLWSYATPIFHVLDKWVHWTAWPVVFSAVSDVAAAPIHGIARPGVDVTVLPNGIDNDEWKVTPAPRDAGTVTVVAVMRLAPRKRPMHLMKMIARVHEQTPAGTRLRLVMIGEGPERGSIESFVDSHGLGDVVELRGRCTRAEIREQFGRSDIFVAPANLESFGIAALEARCAGLPVVAKARTGIREFIAHGHEGLLAESDDDMVAQLVRLVRDPLLRQQIAAHNREVPSSVDWSQVVPLNVAAYREAMARMAGSRPAAAGPVPGG